MDFDFISKMKVEDLKSYLRARGLKISGRKAELVARVFAAKENNVRPIKTAQETELEIKQEYKDKLVVNGYNIPDPFCLTGWLSEEDGISFWPSVLYPDIFNYLAFNPAELGSNDLSDYKNSKAYSYFINGWLALIFYHGINESSPYCFLKADCQPSERLHDPPHKLWICLEKRDTKVQCAHCSCMAGMSQTSNHIAAALFRVEAAIRAGLNNPACTAKACEWLPNRTKVQPMKMRDINFKRDDFGTHGKRKRALVSSPKKHYNPLVDCNIKPLSLHDVAEAVESIETDMILHSAVPKPKVSYLQDMIVESAQKPDDVLSIDDIFLMSSNAQTFLNSLQQQMTQENIMKIEQLTIGQNENENWHLHRKYVITASKSHDVLTKMRKVKGGAASLSMWSLFQKISGLVHVNPNIAALKYGRTMEMHAVNKFEEVFTKQHKDLKLIECGLFLQKAFPFIGGSPDRIVSCSCCERSCLEVKCPISINYTTPQDPNIKLSYLVKDKNNKVSLNRKHKYYTQCQVQMGATGLKKCFFFVWTSHGYFVEEIKFDVHLWEEIIQLLPEFYMNYYLNSFFDKLALS